MTALPAPAPVVTPETAAFWAATARGEFLVPRCNSCAGRYWYPRVLCPFCHSTDTELLAASGRGTVYSFTVVRKGGGDYATATPYVLAYVELDEGPRMMTNVITDDPEAVRIGDRVEVVFSDTGAGAALPRFHRAT
jgi:uncharacterized OB-fold protein